MQLQRTVSIFLCTIFAVAPVGCARQRVEVEADRPQEAVPDAEGGVPAPAAIAGGAAAGIMLGAVLVAVATAVGTAAILDSASP